LIVSFKPFKTFIFDLDGTLWRWSKLNEGAKEVVSKLQKRGRFVYFLTNNTVLSRSGFVQKLRDFGINTDERHVMTAGYAAARFLAANGIEDVYAIGERGLLEELDKAGVKVSDRAKAVLLSTDRNLTFGKIAAAATLLKKGARFFATGKGLWWDLGSEKVPAEGFLIPSLENLTGAKAEVLGKPSDVFRQTMVKELSLYPEDTILIGDDTKSDIVLGARCGFKTALMLGGETTEKEARDAKGAEKPDTIIRELKELIAGV